MTKILKWYVEVRQKCRSGRNAQVAEILEIVGGTFVEMYKFRRGRIAEAAKILEIVCRNVVEMLEM